MKTKNTFAKIVKIVLAGIMVLSLAGCGEEGKIKKKIDAMEQAANSGDRVAFEKAAHDAVYSCRSYFFSYTENREPEKVGKIYQLIDRMLEIGLSAPESSEDDFYFSLTEDGSGVRIDGLKYQYDTNEENRGKFDAELQNILLKISNVYCEKEKDEKERRCGGVQRQGACRDPQRCAGAFPMAVREGTASQPFFHLCRCAGILH